MEIENTCIMSLRWQASLLQVLEVREGCWLLHSTITGNITTISIKCNHSLGLLKVTGYLSYPRGAINTEEERERKRGMRKWQTGSGKENITGVGMLVLSSITWRLGFTSGGSSYFVIHQCGNATPEATPLLSRIPKYMNLFAKNVLCLPLKTLQRRPTLTSR